MKLVCYGNLVPEKLDLIEALGERFFKMNIFKA